MLNTRNVKYMCIFTCFTHVKHMFIMYGFKYVFNTWAVFNIKLLFTKTKSVKCLIVIYLSCLYIN